MFPSFFIAAMFSTFFIDFLIRLRYFLLSNTVDVLEIFKSFYIFRLCDISNNFDICIFDVFFFFQSTMQHLDRVQQENSALYEKIVSFKPLDFNHRLDYSQLFFSDFSRVPYKIHRGIHRCSTKWNAMTIKESVINLIRPKRL